MSKKCSCPLKALTVRIMAMTEYCYDTVKTFCIAGHSHILFLINNTFS